MIATFALLLIITANLTSGKLNESECMDSLWKNGHLSLDMVTVSHNTKDKSQITPDGRGWCGAPETDSIPSNNWIQINFAQPTIVHQLKLMSGQSSTDHVRKIKFLTMFDKHTQWMQLVPDFDTQLHNHSASIMDVNGGNFIKIRIEFVSSDNRPCLKLDLLGCSPSDVCPKCQNGGQCLQLATCRCPAGFIGEHCELETSKPASGKCQSRQGLADKTLSSDNLHVSTSGVNHNKEKGRLNYCCGGEQVGGWCPADTDQNPWFEVTFQQPVAFGGLEIQPPSTLGVLSAPTNYMKTYRLEIKLSADPLHQWRVVANSLEAITNTSISKHLLSVTPNMATDAVRIYPLTYESKPCFRFEILGCDPKELCDDDFCKNGGKCIGNNECECAKGFYGSDCSTQTLTTSIFQITTIINQVIQTTTSLTFNIHGSVKLVSTPLGQAVSVNGSNSYVSIGTNGFTSCLNNIVSCTSGFTVQVNLKLNKLENNTYIISSGGDLPDGIGLALYYSNKELHYVVTDNRFIWHLSTTNVLSLDVWHHLELSWSPSLGIEFLNNGKLIASRTRPEPRPSIASNIQVREITIGYGYVQSKVQVSMIFIDLATYDAKRTDLIKQGVVTVQPTAPSTSMPAKTTSISRTTAIKTNFPGNNGTTEVSTARTAVTKTPATSPTVMKTTTKSTTVSTKSPIQSFNLSFIRITDKILITPLHNFTVYGNPIILPEPNGSAVLVLNTTGQYVELPNMGIQCLQDLTTCDNGFTLNVEIKFLKSSITDKQYIFSSGGDLLNASGIALYLWKGELYCSVKWNKSIWTAKQPLNFQHSEWHTYQVSWNVVDGFIVYIDGQLFMTNTIKLPNPDQPGIHSLLIAKGQGSSITTSLVIRNLYAWTASRDVLIHEHIIQEYTTTNAIPDTTSEARKTTAITKKPKPTMTPIITTTATSSSIVSYNWTFTQLTQSNIITSNKLSLHVYGGAAVDSDKNALHITNSTQYVDFGSHTNFCLGKIDECKSGVTFEVVIAFKSLQENTIIMSSGGEKTTGMGLALVYRFGRIQCIVSTSTVSWFASIPRGKLTINAFNSILVSWSMEKGLILYVEKEIVDFSTTQIHHQLITDSTQHLYFGQPPSVSTSTEVDFYLQSFNCWQVWVDIIIDIDIIIGYPPSKVTTVRPSPVTTAKTTSKKPTKDPATKPPTQSTTAVCHKGWICKDDITSPTTTTKATTLMTTTPKPITPRPTTPRPTTPRPTTPRPTKPGLPIYTTKPTVRPGVDEKGSAFFTCSFEKSFEKDVEFIVCLNIDGNCEMMNIITGISDQFKFTVESINDNLYNKKISCSIQARFKGQSGLTIKFTSHIFTPTITLVNRGKIILTEGNTPHYLELNSTVPPQMFCCPGCKGNCTVILQTHTDADRHDKKCGPLVLPQVIVGWKGSGQSQKAESCGATLSHSNWQNLIQIPVAATVDNMYDRDHNNHFNVQALVTYPRQPPIVTSTSFTIKIGRIDVQAKDNDHKSMCTSLNDPHITTFDGRRYDNFNIGEFILYRHTTLPYEVRAEYKKCSTRRGSKPTCNCAVAVKSGDDVITFSSCGRYSAQRSSRHDHHHHHHPAPSPITIQMFKNGNLTPGTIIRRLGCGQKYEVHLPTGTIITIQSSARPFLNIWIKPASVDFERTEGLCGVYDRNNRNDVVDKRGRPINSKNPDEFSMNWWTSSSIFSGVKPSTIPGITRFCSCVRDRPVFCVGSHGAMRCLDARYDITSTIVAQAKVPQLKSRRKRQTDSGQPVNVLPQPTVDFSLDEAKQFCMDAIYNTSVTKHCDSVVNTADIEERIDNCAADLNTTGDDVWATDSIKDIVEECLAEVDKMPANDSNSNIIEINTTAICTDECLNGNCTQGVCQCEEGFSGNDCSLSAKDTQPTVDSTPLDMEGCDIRQSSDNCQTAMVLGENFIDSPSLTCHYTYVKVTASVAKIGSETTGKASFINMNQVSCRLPDVNSGAYIQISNDGNTKSESQYLHLVYDSTCFDCSIENDTSASHCERLDNSCIIDGGCFASEETKSDDKYKVCEPSTSKSQWTDTCTSDPSCTPEVSASKQEIDKNDNDQIIILAVVCGILGFAFLVAVGYIIMNRSKGKNFKKYEMQENKTATVPDEQLGYDNKMYADHAYRL